jgi:hypothetical protein
VVHEPRTIFPHGFVGVVLHQSKSNANRGKQQPMVKHHLKPGLELLQQVSQFIAKGEPKSYPAVHKSIDNAHTTSCATAN